MTDITWEYINSLLRYDPMTGYVYWKVNRARRRTEGKRAGYNNTKYRRIEINGIGYPEHKLIWLLMTGTFPKEQVDHINRNGFDNRWENLREATNGQNSANRGLFRNNTSGAKGVYYHKRYKVWQVSLYVDRVLTHFGTFKDKATAIQVHTYHHRRIYKEFSHVGERQ